METTSCAAVVATSGVEPRSMLRMALTLDDAPSVEEPGVPRDPARMDVCREVLEKSGVTRCVAFVVGSRCEGCEGVLERWLAAGFELANHTYSHRPAGGQTDAEFFDELVRCDALLCRVGAFEGGRTKWFRFPRLDRGRLASQRLRLHALLQELGYRLAPASIDLLDYLYEAPLSALLEHGDERDAARVDQRFLNTCLETLRLKAAWAQAQRPVLPLIGYAHFGPIAARNIAAIVCHMGSHGFELCSLADAMEHPVYRAYCADFEQNGLVMPNAAPSLPSRVTRRLALLTERFDWFEQRRYGPLLRR